MGSRRINVLHLSDKLTVGDAHMHGVTRLFSWWIPEYDRSRFNVMAGSLRHRDLAGEHLESLGIRVFYLGRSRFDPRTLIDLLRLIARERIDILHLHGYGATTFGRACTLLRGIPSIVHEHMFDPGIPIYQRFADQVLAGATTQAYAVSESVKRFLVEYRAVPAERIETVYNGVPVNAFDDGAGGDFDRGKAAWRLALGIPASHRVIAVVGRLHPIKGHEYFLEAARRVCESFGEVTFVIVGDGDLMAPLKGQVDRLGIGSAVHFLGHANNVQEILSGVDIKVISSLSEGVPLTLFEAMASRCAIVATEVGGLGEVLVDSETAFLVPSQDPEAIADRLLPMLRDPRLLRRMQEQARCAVEDFDLAGAVRQFERAYERLVRQWR